MRGLLLALALAVFAPSAAAQGCGGNGVSLQVLGSGGPELTAKRAASSQLLWIDGRARLLVDAGPGSALRLGESGAPLDGLDTILFSRLDAGHTADLPALVQAAQLAGRTRPLPLYGPAGGRGMPATVTFVRDLFDNTRGAYRHLGEVLAPLARSGFKLDPHDVREPPARLGTPRPKGAALAVFAREGLRVTALPLVHTSGAPALAYRIETGGKTLALLGDVPGTDANLAALLAGADLLVAAHTAPEGGAVRGGPPSPSALGALAQAARAKHLVLTQRAAATLGREDESLAAIRRSYAGPVTFSDDLACLRP
jgi:ribonuclease BN (tRNA processing enzyme)